MLTYSSYYKSTGNWVHQDLKSLHNPKPGGGIWLSIFTVANCSLDYDKAWNERVLAVVFVVPRKWLFTELDELMVQIYVGWTLGWTLGSESRTSNTIFRRERDERRHTVDFQSVTAKANFYNFSDMLHNEFFCTQDPSNVAPKASPPVTLLTPSSSME